MVNLDFGLDDRQVMAQANLTQDWHDRLVDFASKSQSSIVAKQSGFAIACVASFRPEMRVRCYSGRIQIVCYGAASGQMQPLICIDVKDPVASDRIQSSISSGSKILVPFAVDDHRSG